MIKHVRGNLLDSKEDIIIHQVNTLGFMGAGVARSLRHRYPEIFKPYMDRVSEAIEAGATPVFLLGEVVYAPTHDGKEVAHFYGQSEIRNRVTGQEVNVAPWYYDDYLTPALGRIKEKAKREGKTIAMPYGMGCVLGGGNWNRSYEVIRRVFEKSEIEITLYQL